MGRRAIVLLVALILAGLAAWAVWNFLENVRSDAEADREKAVVFVAGSGGISEGADGSILVSAYNSEGQCQNTELPLAEVTCQIKVDLDEVEDLPADAITARPNETVNVEDDLQQLIADAESQLNAVLSGKVAAGPISEGSILTAAQWTEVTVDVVPLSDQIPSGKQALTVSTGNVQGVNGFVEAGDHINMIITLDIEFDLLNLDSPLALPDEPQIDPETGEPITGTDGEPFTVTISRFVMQDIPVMAVGQEVRPDPDAPETVEVTPTTVAGQAEGEPAVGGNETTFTLEVTPEQAERIVFAFQNGAIWLTLVPEDFVEVETNGVTIDNLFGGDLVEAIFGDLNN
jgi:Flp pilus assembly protein CpaB